MGKFRFFITILILIFLLCPMNVLAMQVVIKMETGKNMILEVESSDTVEAVKLKIQDKEDIDFEDQRLIFNGELLEEGRTLADYNIQNKATINLSIKQTEVTVSYKLNNLISSNLAKAKIGENYATILSPNSGYELPDSISIIVGGEKLSLASYTYDKETGNVVILGDVINFDIEINASAIKVVEDENPATADDLKTSFIVNGLSLLGLIGALTYLKNKLGT